MTPPDGTAVAAAVDEVAPAAIALRRRLHAHPELGWTEYYATALLRDALGDAADDLVWGRPLYRDVPRMGVPADDVMEAARRDAAAAGVPRADLEAMADGHTGLVATLDSGRPGPELAIRADIDALAVAESAAGTHRPAALGFASRREGISHACGHDSHAATLVATAAALRRLGQPRRGRVRLLLQPAEEGTRGAQALVDAGWLDTADGFLALHNASRPWLRCGAVTVGVHDMLATVKLDVEFTGREAHAALTPENGRSALLAASAVALLVPALPRRVDAQSVTSVGVLNAGTSRNVVAGSATLAAELRSADDDDLARLRDGFDRLVAGIGAALDIETAVSVVGSTPGAASDETMMGVVRTAVAGLGGIEARSSMPFGASDDAAAMMRRVQDRGGSASYLHIGNDFPGATHTPEFDVNEDIIGHGAKVLTAASIEFLDGEAP